MMSSFPPKLMLLISTFLVVIYTYLPLLPAGIAHMGC